MRILRKFAANHLNSLSFTFPIIFGPIEALVGPKTAKNLQNDFFGPKNDPFFGHRVNYVHLYTFLKTLYLEN